MPKVIDQRPWELVVRILAIIPIVSAMAAELPINSVYGTPAACLQFVQNGPDGVLYGDPVVGDDEPVLLVRPSDMLIHEARCVPDGNALGTLNFSCAGADQEWTWEATLSIQGDVGGGL